MRNWDTADELGSDSSGCEWKQDWEIVQTTCKKLDLPVELVSRLTLIHSIITQEQSKGGSIC
jgi:tRNA U34 2-thiouridine synthase MnmA/TrmU